MKQFDELLQTRLVEGELNKHLAKLAREIHGQSSLNVMAALGAMVAASDGAYLEIGVLQGKSLCGAMVGNEGRTFIGVDDCALAPVGMARNVVEKQFPGVDFHFYPTDFRQFFGEYAGVWENRVSAYYYDANHSLAGQRDGLQLAVGSGILTDEAFIAVDDYSWPNTKRAVGEFLETYPDWGKILEEEDDWNKRGWWNGLVVLYRSGRG